MKIVVTGASGFVGMRLVPLLAAAGAQLLLVGRDSEQLTQKFPGHAVCQYDELTTCAGGFDMLVHLAVANNDAALPAQTFHDVNVGLLCETLEHAKEAGVPCLINVSSVHALDQKNRTPYATSKREAARLLEQAEGIQAITVFLPAVYGDRWSGKLAMLNRLPRWLAGLMFQALSALRPTVHISRLASFILGAGEQRRAKEIIISDGQSENIAYRIVSRTVDLAFALSVALLLWWALALIWLLVRLQSPGPGIFAQERVGKNGTTFTCYKFRTMRQGTAHAGTHEVSTAAVTGIGRFLRRTKLDELPQIWNIFRNEMGLIGPRPCLPVQTELIEARSRRGVLALKPGISGLAQINDIDMSDPERLARWDARYMALQSLLLDLKIIIATALGSGGGDRVARETLDRSR